MQSADIRKNVEQNYWTIGLIGSRELPQFLDREIEGYRRALTEMGLM